MVADIEALEILDASGVHARRLSAKKVLRPKICENVIFTVDGIVKLSRRYQVFRRSTSIRDPLARGEERKDDLREESDEVSTVRLVNCKHHTAPRAFYTRKHVLSHLAPEGLAEDRTAQRESWPHTLRDAVELTLLSVFVSLLQQQSHLSQTVRHTAGPSKGCVFSLLVAHPYLLIGPYAFDMSPCISTLFVSFFKSFVTALIIASAPSLTLNPTWCSCISAMMWSAYWSTATDSISFRRVSRSAIGRSFVFFDQSGYSAEQCWPSAIVVSRLCLPSPASTSEPSS